MQPHQSDCNSGDETLLLSPLSNPSLSNFHPQRNGGADPSTFSPIPSPSRHHSSVSLASHLPGLEWQKQQYYFFPGRAIAHDLMPSPTQIHLNVFKRIFGCLKYTYLFTYVHTIYIFIHTHIYIIFIK